VEDTSDASACKAKEEEKNEKEEENKKEEREKKRNRGKCKKKVAKEDMFNKSRRRGEEE